MDNTVEFVIDDEDTKKVITEFNRAGIPVQVTPTTRHHRIFTAFFKGNPDFMLDRDIENGVFEGHTSTKKSSTVSSAVLALAKHFKERSGYGYKLAIPEPAANDMTRWRLFSYDGETVYETQKLAPRTA